jgi:hypothetical protein
MKVLGAVIREQGQTFAIVVVKQHIVQSRASAERMIADYFSLFRVPVVLMAQDGRGRPSYFGRQDIARFMSKVPLHAIPWREYTIS